MKEYKVRLIVEPPILERDSLGFSVDDIYYGILSEIDPCTTNISREREIEYRCGTLQK